MCSEEVLTLKNNILWVDHEPVRSDASFLEENNLYWSSDGRPQGLNWTFVMSPGSVIADPQFVDVAAAKFNLRGNSPAIGKGVGAPMVGALMAMGFDLAQTLVPSDAPDLGAYQFRTAPWRQRFAIPGRIEAENYRDGGEGTGYHDTTVGNSGRAYREEAVDIEDMPDAGYNVGWIAANEWLAYNVVVATTGSYRITARVATPSVGNRFRIELDGQEIGEPVSVPWTGGWQDWTDVELQAPLSAGLHTLRVVAVTGGFNLDYLHLTKLQ
jgi:hypothetical protein